MNAEVQNPEEFQEESKFKRQLTIVTPLSKFLAMVVFIAAPFVGGWVGYQYAPEKIVEVEKTVYVKNIGNEVKAVTDGSDGWVVYENDLYRLKHPEDCKIKDNLSNNKNLEWLNTTVSLVNICYFGVDSAGTIRVTTDSLDEAIKSEREAASSDGVETIVSLEPTKFGNYQAQKMNFRNKITLLEYSMIFFYQNGLTYVISGADSVGSRWNMKMILSSIETKGAPRE